MKNKNPICWISVREATEMFGLGKVTLYKLMSSKEIEGKTIVKKGSKTGKRMIRYSSIVAFFEAQPERVA